MASLVFLNPPDLFDFGVNFYQWKIGRKFKGMKQIPFGPCLITYSTSKFFKSSIMKFLNKKKPLLVFKWNPEIEEFEEESEEQHERILVNFGEFEPFLGDYPIGKEAEKWIEIGKYLNENVVLELMDFGVINSMQTRSKYSSEWEKQQEKDLLEIAMKSKENTKKIVINSVEEDAIDSNENTVKNNNITNDTINNKSIKDTASGKRVAKENTINFSDFDLKKSFPFPCTPSEKTKYSLDKSYLLKKVFKRYSKQSFLLTEFELSFLLFQIGQFYDAFEHWKQLLTLFCNSIPDDETSEFFMEFLNVFRIQVKEFPVDFFENGQSFFVSAVSNLCMGVVDYGDLDLYEKCMQVVVLIDEKFDWNIKQILHSMHDEDAPIIEYDEDAPIIYHNDTPDTTVNDTPDTTVNDTPDTTVNDTPDTTVNDTALFHHNDTPDTTVNDTPDTALLHHNDTPDTTVNDTPDTTLFHHNDTIDTTVNDTPDTALFHHNDSIDTTVNDSPDTTVNDSPDTTVNDTPDTALFHHYDTTVLYHNGTPDETD
jgi:A1 cistron-splicing factor AAR2